MSSQLSSVLRVKNHPRWSVAIALGVALCILLPGIFLVLIGLQPTNDTLGHLLDTVLAEYALNSALLFVGTAVGACVIGVSTAWLTTSYQFPGRRFLSWALVLPLAVPAYVIAYAYTDLLQFSGPVQSTLRAVLEVKRLPWFPDVRSLSGACLVFIFAFYPYVYLLARTSFLERSPNLSDAARSLGQSPWVVFFRVIFPLARPAIVVGVSLVLMETLADYGAVAYFGVPTFTTGIYKAWLLLGDQAAAAQLALSLLTVVGLLMFIERRSRKKLRFYATRTQVKTIIPHKIGAVRGLVCTLLCLTPVLIGFFIPVVSMLRLGFDHMADVSFSRYLQWLLNSLELASITALVAIIAAILIAYLARIYPSRLVGVATRLISLGYAIPGSVLAIGILLTVTQLDRYFSSIGLGVLLSGSMLALVYAYLVRFLGVALQTTESGLSKITPNIDASARSLGVKPWRILRSIHLPLLRSSVLTGGLLVFVDVIKELPATLLLRPFNYDTLAIITHQLASDERLGEAAFPALSIVLLGLLPIYLIAKSNK